MNNTSQNTKITRLMVAHHSNSKDNLEIYYIDVPDDDDYLARVVGEFKLDFKQRTSLSELTRKLKIKFDKETDTLVVQNLNDIHVEPLFIPTVRN